MEHTKGTWAASNMPTLGWTISSEEQYPIVRFHGYPEAEANAQRIVKAVNCHDELVEALKAVRASVIVNGDMSISYAIDGDIACLIGKALSKVEAL